MASEVRDGRCVAGVGHVDEMTSALEDLITADARAEPSSARACMEQQVQRYQRTDSYDNGSGCQGSLEMFSGGPRTCFEAHFQPIQSSSASSAGTAKYVCVAMTLQLIVAPGFRFSLKPSFVRS
jgi:hypothetical protein